MNKKNKRKPQNPPKKTPQPLTETSLEKASGGVVRRSAWSMVTSW